MSLLDDAMTLMWLEQVALGAEAMGAQLPHDVAAHLDLLRSKAGAGVRRDRKRGQGLVPAKQAS